MLFTTLVQLLLAPLALAESLEPYRHTKRSELHTRQETEDCLPGATSCSARWCANPGDKCCDAVNSAPLDATCCPNGKYAPAGRYCCVGGGTCTVGRTCEDCTAADVPAPWVYNEVPSVRSSAVAVATSTRVVPVREYYTFTITYYYFQLYYIYVEALSRSTPTSSTVTTTTTVSVLAANSAEARSSFNVLSATLALPTPASATFLPPLSSVAPLVVTVTARPTQNVVQGGAGRGAGVGEGMVWVVGGLMGVVGMVI